MNEQKAAHAVEEQLPVAVDGGASVPVAGEASVGGAGGAGPVAVADGAGAGAGADGGDGDGLPLNQPSVDSLDGGGGGGGGGSSVDTLGNKKKKKKKNKKDPRNWTNDKLIRMLKRFATVTKISPGDDGGAGGGGGRGVTEITVEGKNILNDSQKVLFESLRRFRRTITHFSVLNSFVDDVFFEAMAPLLAALPELTTFNMNTNMLTGVSIQRFVALVQEQKEASEAWEKLQAELAAAAEAAAAAAKAAEEVDGESAKSGGGAGGGGGSVTGSAVGSMMSFFSNRSRATAAAAPAADAAAATVTAAVAATSADAAVAELSKDDGSDAKGGGSVGSQGSKATSKGSKATAKMAVTFEAGKEGEGAADGGGEEKEAVAVAEGKEGPGAVSGPGDGNKGSDDAEALPDDADGEQQQPARVEEPGGEGDVDLPDMESVGDGSVGRDMGADHDYGPDGTRVFGLQKLDNVDFRNNNLAMDDGRCLYRAFSECVAEINGIPIAAVRADVDKPVLDLQRKDVRAAETMMVQMLLRECPHVTSVVLAHNRIDAKSGEYLVECLVDITTIAELDLSHNPITNEDKTFVVLEKVKKLLRQTNHLQHVHLRGVTVPADVAKQIDTSLRVNRSIFKPEPDDSFQRFIARRLVERQAPPAVDPLPGWKAPLVKDYKFCQKYNVPHRILTMENENAYLTEKPTAKFY